MEKLESIVSKVLRVNKMVVKVIRCLKAWGMGGTIMCIPLLLLSADFRFGTLTWKTFLSAFIVLFPVLLLFDFLNFRIKNLSMQTRYGVLSLFFILAEIEFNYLPWQFTQITFTGKWYTLVILMFFALVAAIFVFRFLFKRQNLIIVQKEI